MQTVRCLPLDVRMETFVCGMFPEIGRFSRARRIKEMMLWIECVEQRDGYGNYMKILSLENGTSNRCSGVGVSVVDNVEKSPLELLDERTDVEEAKCLMDAKLDGKSIFLSVAGGLEIDDGFGIESARQEMRRRESI